ncbi:MAG: rhodanese-like domain-containing protein [Bacteroidales bacterium]|nr:rhodanese-like domain-containing protein [Bacteroidales bacterium]
MRTNHIFALLAILAGIFAAFTSHSVKNNLYPTWKFEKAHLDGERVRYISAHHLANILYLKQPLTLLDARNRKAYEKYHIPTALHNIVGKKPEGGRAAGIVVLYGSAEDQELYSMANSLSGRVYVLKGGMEAWYTMVLFPDLNQYRVRNSDQIKNIINRTGFFGGEPQNIQLLNINERESRYREGC